MFNPLKMAGDMKGMEKMLKPALEKFMQESGFIKESELKKLEKRVADLEAKLKIQLVLIIIEQTLYIFFACGLTILNFNDMANIIAGIN